MTHNYYHIYPTCPHCLEPNKSGKHLKPLTLKDFCRNCNRCSQERCKWNFFDDNNSVELLHCLNCDSVFYKYIDFSNFKDTLNYINNFDEFNSKIPLLWRIEPNIIENEYLKWIHQINGKFLITWPWEEVKFIPLLISEYLLKNPSITIVVVDDFNDMKSDYIEKPSSLDLFKELIYSTKEDELTDDLEEDWKKFSFKNLFKKVIKYHHSIKLYSATPPQDFTKVETELTLRQYNGLIVKQIKMEYGENSIGSNFINGRSYSRHCSDKGNIILKVDDDQFSWSKKKAKFKNKDYWKNIININNFNRIKNKFKYIQILKDETKGDENDNYLKLKKEDETYHIKVKDFKIDEDTNIYFISNQIDNVFSLINQINPQLVIFPKADEFITDFKIFYTSLGREFSKFLKQTYSDCLLFSTKKDARHLYGFDLSENSFINTHNLLVHTWDADTVLKAITTEEESNKTAGSSSFKDINKSKDLNMTLVEIEELNDFETLIKRITEETENSNYKRYLSRLSRSPLFLFSNNSDLNFNMKTGGVDLSYILGQLYQDGSSLYEDLLKQCAKLYKDDNNPLLSRIIYCTKNLLESGKNNNVKIVLYNKYEVKGFKKIIDEEEINCDRVEVLTWDELNSSFNEDLTNVFVISTSYPHMSYEMFYSNFDNFIFLGSKDYLKTTKHIIENRVDIKNCRPLLYNEGYNLPKLLKDILSQTEDIQVLIEDINEIKIDEPIDVDENISISRNSKQFYLNESEFALILINKNDEGLFLPLDYYIMLKDTEHIVDVKKLNEKNYNNVKNRELIIDANDFIMSFKDIFINFMVQRGSNIEINTGTHKWNDFFDLVENAYAWLNDLNKIVLLLMEKENLTLDEAKNKLATELSESKINAKQIVYIKSRWLNQPHTLKTNKGTLKTYDVESPKGYQSDLFEIYSLISEYISIDNIPEKTLNNYIAIKTLRNLRNSFLKGKKINPTYQHLYTPFQNELKSILRRADLFKVIDIKKVKLTKKVKSFKKMKDFQEFYS